MSYNKAELTQRIIDECSKYEYKNGLNYELTSYGVGAMFDDWWEAKRFLREGFERHPQYDGDGKIVLSEKHYRIIDKDAIRDFVDWMMSKVPREEICIGDKVKLLDGSAFDNVFCCGWNEAMSNWVGKTVTVSGMYPWSENGFYFEEANWMWDKRFCVPVESKVDDTMSGTQTLVLSQVYRDLCMQFADEDFQKAFNEAFPWLKVHIGQKVSRIIRRICKEFKLTDDPEFNSRFTVFADAINPLAITRWTILSINPIDFLLMSNGNSWKSCHWIHKTYRDRGGETSYSGCYSGGTLSYMGDRVSFVVYTVEGSYKGNHYELEPKINRQMFHLGEEKLIQGRLYPQDNDYGAADIYKNFREIVQRVIAQCFGWRNLWTVEKGTDACCDVVGSEGVHYRDYECYGNCNVSYLKHDDGTKNHKMITVGALGICPVCGKEHKNQECILCEDCYSTDRCEHCGECTGSETVRTANGHTYCCAECAEEEGYVYCENSGDWRSAEDGDVMYDSYYGSYQFDFHSYWNNRVVMDDGSTYTTPETARMDGWIQLSETEEWVREEDTRTCPKCGAVVLWEDYDEEHDCCIECLDWEPKFHVGDKVIGNANANSRYSFTREGWVGTVTKVSRTYFEADGCKLEYNCFDLFDMSGRLDFKVGDKVVGNRYAKKYATTLSGWKGIVLEVSRETNQILVGIGEYDRSYWVDAYCFDFDESESEPAPESKFKVGDRVIGNDLAGMSYCITTKGWIGTVTDIIRGRNGLFEIVVQENPEQQTTPFPVDPDAFDLYNGEEVE